MKNAPVIDGDPDDQKIHGRRSFQSNTWHWLTVFIGAAIIARLIAHYDVALPVCRFHNLTGVPCPLCGGTRALRSIADLDLLAAIQFNPLVFLTGALIAGWVGLKVLDRLMGTHTEKTLQRHASRTPLAFLALGFIVLNWLYLIWVLE